MMQCAQRDAVHRVRSRFGNSRVTVQVCRFEEQGLVYTADRTAVIKVD